MVKTLVTDGFAEEIPEPVEVTSYEPHSIVYGFEGWTDDVDAATIDLLVKAGVIELRSTINGVGFETRIYVSRAGTGPVA